MWRRVWLAVAVVAVATVACAQDIQLPSAVYDNAAGEWAVEVISSCRAPAYGTVKFQNTTAHVEWEGEAVPDMVVSGQPTDGPLSLAALASFLSKTGTEYVYTACEHQENYLETPKRPNSVAQLTSTFLTMYTGVLGPANSGSSCDSAAHRNVVIQALGSPLKAGSSAQWKLQEALYTIEMIIETRELDGSCAQPRAAETAEAAAAEGKKRSRKRRVHRGFSNAAAASQADDALLENGVVTLRFVRRSAATSSWAVRYYTPLLFASIMIVYRVVHSYVSTRTAKVVN